MNATGKGINRNPRSTIITFTHLVNLLICDCNTISGGWSKIKGTTAFYRIKELAPSGTFTPIEISYLIEKGFLQYGFERHDITREIHESGVEYIRHVLSDIHGELQAHVGMQGNFDKVLLFGGGAAFLKNDLQVKNIEVVTLPEPEYANARGFCSLLKL